jgi:hypothetical protein
MVDGDILLEDTGRTALVAGIEKCAQDLAETLMMGFSPELQNGNDLLAVDFPVATSRAAQTPVVSLKLSEAVTRLQDLQTKTAYTTADEAIDHIEAIKVYAGDQLNVIAYVSVITKSNEPVEKLYDISLKHQTDYDVMKRVADNFVAGVLTGSP